MNNTLSVTKFYEIFIIESGVCQNTPIMCFPFTSCLENSLNSSSKLFIHKIEPKFDLLNQGHGFENSWHETIEIWSWVTSIVVLPFDIWLLLEFTYTFLRITYNRIV